MVSKMADEQKFDVFISYSRRDYVDEHKNVIPGNVVSKIKDSLTTAGISYWFDEEGINHGDKFAKLIVRNIKKSRIFVFISTKNSNSSEWTGREIASAHMMKKSIIPIRIDDSAYNEDVMFYISILDYIDYKANPEKGIKSLVQAINQQLERMQEEQIRKQEEEEKKRLEEQKRLEEERLRKMQKEQQAKLEQEKIISDIEVRCTQLNNEEVKLELDRKNLLLGTEKVTDEEKRNSLKSLIISSSLVHKKAQGDNEALRKASEEYKKQIKKLTEDRDKAVALISDKVDKIEALSAKESSSQQEIGRLNKELSETRERLCQLETKLKRTSDTAIVKSNKRLKIGVAISVLVTLVMSIVALRQSLNSEQSLTKQVEKEVAAIVDNEADIPINQSNNIQRVISTIPEVADEKVLRAVDLGLSVKWANINVGARSSYEIGSYFAWGEISTKLDYKKGTYKHYKNGRYTLIGEEGEADNGNKYYNIGNTEYDAALKNLGGKWRMPTETECLELKNKCTWIWSPSKSGYLVIGKNGNCIFLPATGCMSEKHVAFLHSKAKKGFYWSSKTANTSQYSYGESASVLQFDPNGADEIVVSPIDRAIGRCVRAVCE